MTTLTAAPDANLGSSLYHAWEEHEQELKGQIDRLVQEGYAARKKKGRKLCIPLRPTTRELIEATAVTDGKPFREAKNRLAQELQLRLRVPNRPDHKQPKVQIKLGPFRLRLVVTKL